MLLPYQPASYDTWDPVDNRWGVNVGAAGMDFTDVTYNGLTYISVVLKMVDNGQPVTRQAADIRFNF